MQFHQNGFEPGDPENHDPAERYRQGGAVGPVPDEVDVLIVGTGPAGLTLAAQLAAFPEIRTCIVEQRPTRLFRGQADGIACRTMEMFEAFGFAERVAREACWILETTFWKPEEAQPDHIARSGRVQDTEDGLSEFPHVILNQARVQDFYLDVMRKAPARLAPHYSRRLVSLSVDDQAAAGPVGAAYPVTATLERLDPSHEGRTETIRARFVVGCDGARSSVRKAMGLALEGDSANQAWGVMDLLAVTDFPDIRMKALIQSARDGSMVLIPREGGHMVRLYVELDKLAEGERVSQKAITAEDLVATARRILHPYTLEVKDIPWWSVYEIGQRLCPRFDDRQPDAPASRLPRLFIAGDACHTHSPKAGQGMNVSMQDSFNLGWKLAQVLRGAARPELLATYSEERQAIARELIEFDREWAGILGKAKEAAAAGLPYDPSETQRYFVQHGRYTAGTATQYRPSLLTADARHQALAPGFAIGTRFHSAPVIRLADAKPMHLGHVAKADGRWRLFAFADAEDDGRPEGGIGRLCGFLDSAASPVRRFTPARADIDAVIDVRAIFRKPHRSLAIERMPTFLLPLTGRLRLRDYEKIFCNDPADRQNIFVNRGVDSRRGCVVILRPDQFVSALFPLDAHAEISAFFERILLPGA
ncbi:FAD-binding monooxygenase [Rhabdaerophilum sp. SD176]|uniref:FAD-binding monooxygenase n=1 Tax=Rhabdaerophilum sp. SD176 TaxID=2983548 RepID=UPI0024E00FB6|nr:FAD-binding monooxygenase [Rhabdaerophilum sp. SD176]